MGGVYVRRTKFFSMFILIASLIMSVGYATINSTTLTIVGTIYVKKEIKNLYANMSEITKDVDSVIVEVVEEESYFDINVDVTKAYKNGELSFVLEFSLENTSNMVIGCRKVMDVPLSLYMDVFCSIPSLITPTYAINPGKLKYYYIEVTLNESIPEDYTNIYFSIRVNFETCASEDASECFLPT